MKKEETKRSSFNALDIVVICVILALLITVLVRSGLAEKLTFSGEPFMVTMEAENTDGLNLQSMKGAVVYTEAGETFGTVSNIRTMIDGNGNTYTQLDITVNLMKKEGRLISQEGISVVKGAQIPLHSQLVSLDMTVENVNGPLDTEN